MNIRLMTKKEVGDISLLAAIKDQLEVGIDDCRNMTGIDNETEYHVNGHIDFIDDEHSTVLLDEIYAKPKGPE